MNPKVRAVSISELVLDESNANKGTKRGRELLEESLERYQLPKIPALPKNLSVRSRVNPQNSLAQIQASNPPTMN